MIGSAAGAFAARFLVSPPQHDVDGLLLVLSLLTAGLLEWVGESLGVRRALGWLVTLGGTAATARATVRRVRRTPALGA